jgi:hypothetical protein
MPRQLWLPALLCLIAACTQHAADPDASVAIDVASPGALQVTWSARPEVIPGRSDSDLSIERAVFRTRDLRVIGDATPAALPRFALEWAAGVNPAPRVFPDAQLGTYSRLLFSLDPGGDTFAYEISGKVEVEDVLYPFVIRDRQPVPIALDFVITLAPGESAVIPVRVEIDKLASRVEFEHVVPTAGQLIVEDGNSELAGVRSELAQAFGVHSSE